MNTLKVIGIFLMNAVMLALAFGLLRLAVAVPHSEAAFATVEFLLAVVCWGGSSWALYLFMQESDSLDWEIPAVVIATGTVAFLLTGMYPAFARDFIQPGAFFAAFAVFAAALMFVFSAVWTVARLRNRGKPQEEQVAS
jgi:hypothetical protein